VTIGYQELPDGSIYFTRKVSFRTDDSFSLSQYTPENKIHRRLLRTLERHASEFLPKKSDEINEHTWKSLWTIHYLPNSK
jgi:hypothetical protein